MSTVIGAALANDQPPDLGKLPLVLDATALEHVQAIFRRALLEEAAAQLAAMNPFTALLAQQDTPLGSGWLPPLFPDPSSRTRPTRSN